MSVTQPPGSSLGPKTTEQESVTLAGQRRINLIWEFTQAIIAVTAIGGYLGIVAHSALKQQEFKVPESMTNIIFLIVGFYFSRTNHAAIGGTGPKVEGRYDGR